MANTGITAVSRESATPSWGLAQTTEALWECGSCRGGRPLLGPCSG